MISPARSRPILTGLGKRMEYGSGTLRLPDVLRDLRVGFPEKEHPEVIYGISPSNSKHTLVREAPARRIDGKTEREFHVALFGDPACDIGILAVKIDTGIKTAGAYPCIAAQYEIASLHLRADAQEADKKVDQERYAVEQLCNDLCRQRKVVVYERPGKAYQMRMPLKLTEDRREPPFREDGVRINVRDNVAVRLFKSARTGLHKTFLQLINIVHAWISQRDGPGAVSRGVVHDDDLHVVTMVR